MSGKFVRQSKFRHVFGDKKMKAGENYADVKSQCIGEGNHIEASTDFFAFALNGGGAPVGVWSLKDKTRLPNKIPTVNVHKTKLTDFKFSPFMPNLLATSAEDCLIKLTLFPEDEKDFSISEEAASLTGHMKKVALMNFNPVANNVLASCGYDNVLKVWDIEKTKEICETVDHPEYIYSLEWKLDASLLATTCKDKLVRVFDPRNARSSMQTCAGLEGAKGMKCVWLNDKLGVVGFNKSSGRCYSIYDPRNFSAPLASDDLDNASGAFMPWFDPDLNILYLTGKGDGNIRYFEISDEKPYVFGLSEFRDSQPHKGICYLPKRACETKSCEIVHCLRLMRDHVQPVSFQVPRKSDLFQSDIFPDCYAGVPSMTSDEYLSGKVANPITKSMKPEDNVSSSKPSSSSFTAKPSSSSSSKTDELEKRIAHLEALLRANNISF